MKTIKGIIVSGLGEGAVFMSMQHYRQEIKKKLGFDPYPGTLNLKINNNRKNLLKDLNMVKIIGFALNDKNFGGASCVKAKIRNVDGAIIVPEINKNPEDILELIAPVHIKSALELNNNDEVEIEFL